MSNKTSSLEDLDGPPIADIGCDVASGYLRPYEQNLREKATHDWLAETAPKRVEWANEQIESRCARVGHLQIGEVLRPIAKDIALHERDGFAILEHEVTLLTRGAVDICPICRHLRIVGFAWTKPRSHVWRRTPSRDQITISRFEWPERDRHTRAALPFIWPTTI